MSTLLDLALICQAWKRYIVNRNMRLVILVTKESMSIGENYFDRRKC